MYPADCAFVTASYNLHLRPIFYAIEDINFAAYRHRTDDGKVFSWASSHVSFDLDESCIHAPRLASRHHLPLLPTFGATIHTLTLAPSYSVVG